MGLFNKAAQYKEYKNGITHCTFNPEGPGVVRIHLIPPKFRLFSSDAYIVILNGYYLLPIGYSWALILSAFMREVNKFDSMPISEEDVALIEKNTVKTVHRAYPTTPAEYIREDLYEMLDVIFAVASGEKTDAEIEKLSIRAYKDSMTAPHRTDLMVSAMTDSDGKWNCNQKCVFCYAAGQCKSNLKELSTEEWKKAIDRLYKARVPMLTFTGGEPTMREDIIELIDYSKWFVTRLNTNGINLTEDFCVKLKLAGLDSVQITLYSADEAIHNSLVGSEHFKDTVQGIRNAVKVGLDISINTPLCRVNADYMNTLKLIAEAGVRFVTVSGLICTGFAESNHEAADLSEEELFEILEAAKEYCDSNGLEIDFTSPGLVSAQKLQSIGMKVPMCGAALSNMAVCPDGTVVPCQSWLDEESGLGNILTDDFSLIWNNRKCVKLRNMSEDEALLCLFRKRGEG